jgi:plastocyanin
MRAIPAVAAALAALAVPAAAQRPSTVIPIALYSFGYGPSPIQLRAGTPATLVFTNRSNIGHEFKAPEFFRAARILSGSPAGEIDLKGGQSASVTLVPAAGTYPVHCGHFMHTQMGMRTAIVVS